MKRIAQLIVTIVIFLASTFAFNIIGGLLIGKDTVGLYFLGAFPGQTQGTYLERYFGFLSQDTLGWFTFLTLAATQNMQILASSVTISGGCLVPFLGFMWPTSTVIPTLGPVGLIPVMTEYHPWSSLPTYFNSPFAWFLMLVGPFLITGIVAGAVAKTKKNAMGNMFLSMLVIGIAGIVLNSIHVYMNFPLSVAWKFDSTISQNPIYALLWLAFGITNPNEIAFAIGMSIVALAFAAINGLIFSILSVIVAKKK